MPTLPADHRRAFAFVAVVVGRLLPAASLAAAMLLSACRHAEPTVDSIPPSAQLRAEGDRDSHACMTDEEPAARDRFREVAAEYHAFRVECGPALDDQWDAVVREAMFGTRHDHCRRVMMLLDQLDAAMKRERARR